MWIPKNSSRDQSNLLRILDLSQQAGQRTPNQWHSPSRHSQQNKQVHCQNTVQRWIPKKLYQDQQQGQQYIWVPKMFKYTSMSSPTGVPSSPIKQEPYHPQRNPATKQKSSQPRWILRRLLTAQANLWKIWILKKSQASNKTTLTKQMINYTCTTSKSSLPKPITPISKRTQTV